MTRRTRKVLLIGGAVLLVLAVLLAVPWKVNFLRDDVARRVEAATGRAFAIEGDLWWHWTGRVVAERLRFANPPWAGREQMLTVDEVDARLKLLPLLRRQLVLTQVRAVRPDLWLETTADGRFNGNLDRGQSDEGSAVQLGEVLLDRGLLTFVQQHRDTKVRVAFENAAAETGQEPRLSAEASGLWRGMEVKASGTGDSVLRLRDASREYMFDIAGTVGRTAMEVAGGIQGLVNPTAANLGVAVQGPSMHEWKRIADVALPRSPPYLTYGRLRLQEGVWHYDDFTGRVGRSELAGSLRYEPREQRPLLAGRLTSSRLHLDDLAAVTGADRPPEEAPKQERGEVLPQWQFDPRKWDAIDVNVRFEARSVEDLGQVSLQDVKLHVVLDNRALTIDPLDLRVAGGTVRGMLAVDGRRQPAAARLEAQARGLDLAELLPMQDNQWLAMGNVHGKLVLAGRGNALDPLLDTADGEMQLAMGQGRVSNLLLELLGLDAGEALGFLVAGDEPVAVRCALVDMAVDSGVVQARTMVFDTTDTIVHATGQVSLDKETLDLRVRPVAKDPSLLSLRVPFNVKGTFAQPKIMPDRSKLALRAGGALLLGAINPLAALIPLIETGPGKDSDCGALVARARSEGVPVKDEPTAAGRRGTTPPAPQNRK